MTQMCQEHVVQDLPLSKVRDRLKDLLREGKEVLFFIPAVEMMCVAPYIFSGNSAHISISLIPVHLKSSLGGISQAQD